MCQVVNQNIDISEKYLSVFPVFQNRTNKNCLFRYDYLHCFLQLRGYKRHQRDFRNHQDGSGQRPNHYNLDRKLDVHGTEIPLAPGTHRRVSTISTE
jgi:hypothetical protein